MASEFKIKNGLIVVGDVSTSGTITINGALAATQSWVSSQAYLTSANLSGYATQSYVTSAISALVDAAPAALDTLNELAAALGDDANFSTTITNSIASKQAQLNGTGLVRMSGTSVSYDNSTYLTSYTETDTLATVTGRGATTNTSITVGHDLTVQADGGSGYTASRLWLNSHNNYRGAGVHMSGTGSTWFAGTPYTDFDGGYVIARTGTSNDQASAQYSNALLTVKSSGNVGVGTSNPGSKLSVFGNNDVFSVISQTADTSFATRLLAQYVGLFNNGANGHHLYINSSQELGPAEFNLTKTWGGLLTLGVSGDGTFRTRALYVNSNGYVGVNVNPISGDRFEVAGSVRIHTGNNWDAIQIYSDGANGYIQGLGDETGLRIRSEYGNILLADNRGNVGIGTSSPTGTYGKLSVAGGISILNDNNAKLEIGRYSSGASNSYIKLGANSNSLRITNNTDIADIFTIENGGNVGIGTTNPNAKLHLSGSGVTELRITSTTGNTNSLLSFYESALASWGIDAGQANGSFFIKDLYNSATRLTISYTGNVGIGTTSPDTPLVVQGGSAGTGGWNRTATLSATYPGLIFNSNGTKWGGMAYDYSAAMRFWVNASNNDIFAGTLAMSILNNGNVGIGTSNPIYKLQVAGSAYVNGGTLFIDSEQYLRWGNSNQGIVGVNDSHVAIVSGGATRQTIYAEGRTYFPGLDLSISNVNGSHGSGTYFRGDGGHFVFGLSDGNTLYLNYGNSSGILRTFGTWYHESTQILSTSRVLTNVSGNISMFTNDAGYLTSVSDVWVNTSGDTMTGTLTIQGGWASTILDGDNVVLRKPNYSAGGWARTLLNFQEYDGTSLFQIGGYGSNNVMTYGYLGSAYNTPTIKWYANKNVYFSGNILIDDAADNNRYQKGATFLNLRDPWNNLHLSTDSIGGNYIDANVHYWRPAGGASYWMTLNGGNLGIGTTSPTEKLHVNGDTRIVGNTYVGGIINAYQGDASIWVPNLGQAFTVKQTTGNVGIGTTSPNAKLHVEGSSSDGVPVFRMNGTTAPNAFNYAGSLMNSSLGSSRNTILLIGKAESNRDSGYIGFNHSGTNSSNSNFLTFGLFQNDNILNITGAGNVGIGTTTPQVKLDVNGHVGIVGSSFIYFGHTTTNIGAWTTRTYASGSTHKFNAQTFIFNNEGYGSVEFMAVTANGINLRAKNTIDSTDSWLRLNQSGDYGSGVYTPGLMRADGGFQVSGSTVWHAGNDGSGSGLDADTVDGIDSGSFLRSDVSDSFSGTLTMATQRAFVPSNYGHGVYGLYSAEKYQHVWSMGAGYDLPADGVSNGNGGSLYGLAWSYNPDYSYVGSNAQSKPGLNHQLLLMMNGITYTALGNGIWTSGTITTTSHGNSSQWNTAYGWGNHASASYATTSYVTTQINNLIAGAPGVLDTLDELAAALGDDANFATTVTNSIATKLPLAGGTMSGSIAMGGNNITNIGQVNAAHAIFTNDGSSRVMYLRGSGNIIQFQDGAAANKWELVGRDTEFYVYKNDGAGSGMAWRIDGAGIHTIYNNLIVNGTVTENSSIKLKENVETSEGNLEKVVNLRPVTYNKIGSQTTELGLIAEEVAEVYPEFVQYDENGEPVGVNYSRLTAALIGAVKELNEQLQELKRNK